MGSSLLALGVAWYQKLPRKKAADCECETEPKRSFLHSKSFLGMVTVFAILMLAFPYYAGALYASSDDNQTSIYVNPEPAAFELLIDGMTCTGCEVTIEQTVLSLPGVTSVNADFKTGKATILADTSRASIDEIREKIEETGYAVLSAKSTKRQDVPHPPADDQETKEKK
jgi:copper chaperone CopZ